jgi:predicted metal-binding membrane protein
MTTAVALGPQHERHEVAPALAAARSRAGVVATILAVAGIAWWATVERMTGMDAGPGTTLGTLAWFTGVWIVMMAAMMLPSLAPTAAVVATLTRRREPTVWMLFAAGYLLVWSAAGVLAYGLYELGHDLLAHDLAWRSGGRGFAAGVLAFAAIYELTPLKGACLLRCRAPVRFVRRSWRDGRAGALEMGARNGIWCLGCSWALMAGLFALGVMSLTWMALVAALVALQKVGPWRRCAALATAGVLLALTVGIAVAPRDVPGLVVPGGSGVMHAMKAMD